MFTFNICNQLCDLGGIHPGIQTENPDQTLTFFPIFVQLIISVCSGFRLSKTKAGCVHVWTLKEFQEES